MPSATDKLHAEYERALARGFTGRLYNLVIAGYPIPDRQEFIAAFIGRQINGSFPQCITTDVVRLTRLVNKGVVTSSEVYPLILTCSDVRPVIDFIARHPPPKKAARAYIRTFWVNFFIWGRPLESDNPKRAVFLRRFLSDSEFHALCRLGRLFDKKTDLELPADFHNIEDFVVIQQVLHS